MSDAIIDPREGEEAPPPRRIFQPPPLTNKKNPGVVSSLDHAADGLVYAVRRERNLKIHFVAAVAVLLLTLALLGSTRLGPMACGIMAVVLFGVTWMMGVAGAIGVAFQNQAVTNVGVIASLILPTDGLWRAAAYHLSPAILLATAAQTGVNGNPFIVAAPPTPAYHIWAALWIMAALALAIYSFEHRDL